MQTDFTLEAHLSALLFLAGFGGFFLIILSAIVCAFVHKMRLARLALMTAGGGAAFYLLLLLGFSAVSQEKVLAVGVEKHLCELDCHLAYSVTGVEQRKTLGEGAKMVQAKGTFYVVHMKARFDEATTSPQRPKDATLAPNPHHAFLGDAFGHRLDTDLAGQQALAIPADAAPLLPGQSAEIAVVFDVPDGPLHADRILFTQDDTALRWVIGQENSWGHAKVWFGI